MKHLCLYEDFNGSHGNYYKEVRVPDQFYHGATSQNFAGKTGIHVGSHEAAKEALEATIGVKADGKDWDGKQEYGKTLLAGKNTMKKLTDYHGPTGYNCDAPDEDYYPGDVTHKATYSDRSEIPLDCKPIVFPVKIIGQMSNTPRSPHTDSKANGLMRRTMNPNNTKKAKSGFYYVNDGEDPGSISAVVPDKSFLSF